MLQLAGVSVRVEGVENLGLDGAFIIVANHESWFDVWALAGCLPIDAHFVVKKELEQVPIVPVGLVESRPIMPKGSFRIRPGTTVVRVGAPISVAGVRHSD